MAPAENRREVPTREKGRGHNGKDRKIIFAVKDEHGGGVRAHLRKKERLQKPLLTGRGRDRTQMGQDPAFLLRKERRETETGGKDSLLSGSKSQETGVIKGGNDGNSPRGREKEKLVRGCNIIINEGSSFQPRKERDVQTEKS